MQSGLGQREVVAERDQAVFPAPRRGRGQLTGPAEPPVGYPERADPAGRDLGVQRVHPGQHGHLGVVPVQQEDVQVLQAGQAERVLDLLLHQVRVTGRRMAALGPQNHVAGPPALPQPSARRPRGFPVEVDVGQVKGPAAGPVVAVQQGG